MVCPHRSRDRRCLVQRLSGNVEHRYPYVHSFGHEPEVCSSYLPHVLRRSTHKGQIPTPCASASTPPSHIHRNCCLLWCIHFVVGAIPERTTVGPQHHLGRACVPNSHCCVANIFPSQNNFRIIDYPSIVKIIDDRRIRREGPSSRLFLLRCEAALHDARTPCSAL